MDIMEEISREYGDALQRMREVKRRSDELCMVVQNDEKERTSMIASPTDYRTLTESYMNRQRNNLNQCEDILKQEQDLKVEYGKNYRRYLNAFHCTTPGEGPDYPVLCLVENTTCLRWTSYQSSSSCHRCERKKDCVPSSRHCPLMDRTTPPCLCPVSDFSSSQQQYLPQCSQCFTMEMMWSVEQRISNCDQAPNCLVMCPVCKGYVCPYLVDVCIVSPQVHQGTGTDYNFDIHETGDVDVALLSELDIKYETDPTHGTRHGIAVLPGNSQPFQQNLLPLCSALDDMKMAIERMRDIIMATSGLHVARTSDENSAPNSPQDRLVPMDGSRPKGKRKCRWCGQRGHYKKTCIEAQGLDNKPPIRSFIKSEPE